MAIKIGDKAPGFTLHSETLEEISLAGLQGKPVLLLFFPLAFTGVCTAELCSMRDDIASYNKLDAQILAISIDSPFVLKEFKAQQNLNFPLLSDFNKEVAAKYDTLYEVFVKGLKGVAKRSAFVIDKDGVVRYAEVLESAADLPNFDAVKKTLAAL